MQPVSERPIRPRVAILIALLLAALAGLGLVEPIPQDPAYHLFADTRPLFGIPNFNDVASNAAFALAGAFGAWAVTGARRRALFPQPADARPYAVFFVAVALVGLGSGYYHWEPSNQRLLWDRLPMSIAFMAFSSAVVADRVDARAGNGWLLVLLVTLGLSSLLYWHHTEQLGRGDLRFYALVQFYPLLALPAVLWLFPRRRFVAGPYLAWVLAWYGLSKVLEHLDAQVFEILGRTLSGHTLKHLAAAFSVLVVLRMLTVGRSAGRRRDSADGRAGGT